MANHKQALKRHRQSVKAHARNVHFKTMTKTIVKKAIAVENKDAQTVQAAFRAAESVIMHVASKGVIPRKRAARKVSRLAKRLHQSA